jgi:hypothetical protein
MKFVSYDHYGSINFVREDLKGQHREHCLCFSCLKFHPKPEDMSENCPRARLLYNFCVLTGMVTPVWECSEFAENKER